MILTLMLGRFCLFLAAVFACGNALALAAAPARGDAPPPLLQDISRIRHLDEDLAAKALPVRVRGVLVWHAAHSGAGLIVHDGREGIWAALDPVAFPDSAAAARLLDALLPGTLVEIEGLTGQGEYAPIIQARRIERVGTGSLPAAQPVRLADLLTGAWDAQYVEIEGVVRSVEVSRRWPQAAMTLVDRDGPFRVVLSGPAIVNPARLVDARVRVRGVAFSLFNSRREILGASVQTNDAAAVEVLTPPPRPEDIPVVPLRKLRAFSPEPPSLHRRRVNGVVTAARSGYFFLEQQGRAIQVFTDSKARVAPGDVLEVLGFVGVRGANSCLENAVFHQTGTVTLPEAAPISVEKVIGAGQAEGITGSMDWHGRLVSIVGTLVARENQRGSIRATVESEGRFISVAFDAGAETPLPARLQPGSVVRVVGAASIGYRGQVPSLDYVTPQSISLIPRSFDDFAVLRPPPWWTAERLTWVLGGAGALAFALLAWVRTLRWQVTRQAHELFQQKRALRDGELEREAVRHERDRMAGELHDGLQQWLSSVALHINAATAAPALTPQVADHLRTAQHAIGRTQEELRRSLWAIHETQTDAAPLVATLERSLHVFADWREARITVSAEGEPAWVPAHVAGSLGLVAQEAVGNALRHGQATEVRLLVQERGPDLLLTIADNGTGFDKAALSGDPDHHYGLAGMKARLRRLGGVLKITAAPGAGTTVTATLPRETAGHDTPALTLAPKVNIPADARPA